MYFHSFLFRWKPGSTHDHRLLARQEISAFSGAIPGLLEMAVGDNLAANDGGYTLGGYMKFTDAEAYRAYCDHPLHQRLLAWLVPLIDAVELDLLPE